MTDESLIERAKSLGIKDLAITTTNGVKVYSYTMNRRGKILKGSSTEGPFRKFLDRLELERTIREKEAERRRYYKKWPETRAQIEKIDGEIEELKRQLRRFIGG